MATYLVSPLASDRFNTNDTTHALVVSAGSAGDARAICKHYRTASISATAWDNATVTELVDVNADGAAVMSGWHLHISIPGAPNDAFFDVTGVLGIETAAIGAGGASYNVNDILTVAGGTSTRAATFRVTSETGNAVDGIELVDSGHYTVLPTGTQATTVEPAGGTGCTLSTFTGSATKLHSFLAHAVTMLNAHTDIAGAAVDMGASPPLLTVADTDDALGDLALVVRVLPADLLSNGILMSQNDISIPGMVGTVTDEGDAGDALTVEFPAPATLIVPRVYPFA
jgi:hypothetical protein